MRSDKRVGGLIEAADRLTQEARAIYPTHFALWFSDCYAKLYTGRASAAAAMIEDVDGRPTGIPPEEFEAVLKVARAMISRDPAEIDATVRLWRDRARLGADPDPAHDEEAADRRMAAPAH